MFVAEDILKEVPPVTRLICGSSLLIHLLIYLEAITEYDVFLNANLVFSEFQVWRLFTSFLFFGELSILTAFSLGMLYYSSKKVEEHVFKNGPADYIFFLIISMTIMASFGLYFGFTNLSTSFETMLFYLVGRSNQHAVFLILGLFPVRAPYVAWTIVGINVLFGQSIAEDLLGIGIAHIFYFLNDVYPRLPLSKGKKLFQTPGFLSKVVDKLGLQRQDHIFIEDPIEQEGGQMRD